MPILLEWNSNNIGIILCTLDSNPQPSPLRQHAGGGVRAAAAAWRAITLQQGVRRLSAPASNGLPLHWAHFNCTLNLKFE